MYSSLCISGLLVPSDIHSKDTIHSSYPPPFTPQQATHYTGQ